jgi:hypothetical protein
MVLVLYCKGELYQMVESIKGLLSDLHTQELGYELKYH